MALARVAIPTAKVGTKKERRKACVTLWEFWRVFWRVLGLQAVFWRVLGRKLESFGEFLESLLGYSLIVLETVAAHGCIGLVPQRHRLAKAKHVHALQLTRRRQMSVSGHRLAHQQTETRIVALRMLPPSNSPLRLSKLLLSSIYRYFCILASLPRIAFNCSTVSTFMLP